ncbi:MAG: hypothetical protein OEO21_04750 [Candidatus Krumholzibacteria bacterium]|nr:hypothetical protein [Candidatus Krumholzibacteria bacterium]
MAEAQGVPKTWRIGIRKVEGRWMIEKPKGKLNRGIDSVEWTLHGKKGDAVTAHFQFPAVDLLENDPDQHDLTRDMTARIAGPGETLKLKVQEGACRRRNPRYYAVWIRDETLANGGEYAVGEDGNPPPELQVGP